MSWIKLDDQIAHHPKFTKISPAACWLYVCGIGFCQKFLTDGHIPFDSVSKLSHVRFPSKSATELVQSQLWVRGESGYTVHDYLEFNDTAEYVKNRREIDRRRKLSERNPRGQAPMSSRIPSDSSRARASHPIPSHPDHVVRSNKLTTPTPVNPNSNGHGVLVPSKAPPLNDEDDPLLKPEVTRRAAAFIDHYAKLYPKHRNGARYTIKPGRDWEAAVTLCNTWDDDERLNKLAICFLTTDHQFAAKGSRTIGQFLALASSVDGELAEWEKKHATR